MYASCLSKHMPKLKKVNMIGLRDGFCVTQYRELEMQQSCVHLHKNPAASKVFFHVQLSVQSPNSPSH